MGKLSEADADLEKSYQIYVETSLRFELPNILHRRGHVAWEFGKKEEAEDYFKQSAEIGRKVFNLRETVNSLEGLVELYYSIGAEYHEKGDTKKRDEWYTKAEEEAKRWKEDFEDEGYYFPLYSGSRLRTLGNIAFDRGDYDAALEKYIEAYRYIAKREGWGHSTYTMNAALEQLQKRLDQLPPQLSLEWCDRLEKSWTEEGLDRTFSEMRAICKIGRDNAKLRAMS